MARRRKTTWTNPILTESAEERSRSLQNRIADAITEFAGSMPFVYLHIVWFAAWIGFRVESYPFGLLTMIVSLEAIFLSTFVMISQNRADLKRARSPSTSGSSCRPRRSRTRSSSHVEADPRSHEADPLDDEVARARHLLEQHVQGLRRLPTGGRSRGFRSTSGGGT